jgi:glutamate racemase
MADPVVTLIHATPAAMAPVNEAARRLGGFRVLNLLDEGLLSEAELRGGIAPECVRRLATVIGLAVDAGSAGVLVTCTIYSAAVTSLVGRFAPMPLLAVDDPMVQAAVGMADRIGLVATLAGGLREQTGFIRSAAVKAGKTVEITSVLREDALEAALRGDAAAHDAAIAESVRELGTDVDVVVLAQASMARALDGAQRAAEVPVLASPMLAVAELRRMLTSRAARQPSPEPRGKPGTVPGGSATGPGGKDED